MQLECWVTSKNAVEDLGASCELILMEQFNSQLEVNMYGWLIDQKPISLSELPTV